MPPNKKRGAHADISNLFGAALALSLTDISK
jgi:hypothetical protein